MLDQGLREGILMIWTRFLQWVCRRKFTGGRFQQCWKCGKIRVVVTGGIEAVK